MISTFFKRWFFLLFLTASYITNAQTGLKITYYDGTTQGFAVSENGKLYFSGTNLMIKTDANASATSIPVSIVKKIVFDSSVLSAQNVSATSKSYLLYPNPSNDFIRIKTFKNEKLDVTIYSIDGKILLKNTYASDQNIDISSLKTGIYIVKANNESFKLIKK